MDQYQLLKKIGSGSYGVVWGALDEHTDKVVAIKKLNTKFDSVKECIKLREVKALRKMDHPNIIKVKEIIREHDTIYLVLEYMEYTLHQRMMLNKKPFSETEIRNMCFQIFQGLAHMHEKGYFHRDLKPENLLVSKDVIKIADLGLARETNGKPPYTDNVGTRWYRAPEVLLHARVYDSTVDMWAMGAIMAELFTGWPLFHGDSIGDQLYQNCSVIGSPPEWTWSLGVHRERNASYQFPQLPGVELSSVLPSASAEALNLIGMLLSWSPSLRPTAMEALQHPFFYKCYYHVPPLVFEMGRRPEFLSLKKTSTESCITDHRSEKGDAKEDLMHLLPENLFD